MLIFLIGIGIIGIIETTETLWPFLPFYFFTFLLFYFFTLLPFLYQALEGPEQFIAHADGVTLDAEIPIHLYRTEIQAQRAISLTGDGDVPTLEHVRIALAGSRRNGLDERVVLVVIIILTFNVTAQDALIVLTGLQALVVAEDGFQIYTESCVAVPALEHV